MNLTLRRNRTDAATVTPEPAPVPTCTAVDFHGDACILPDGHDNARHITAAGDSWLPRVSA